MNDLDALIADLNAKTAQLLEIFAEEMADEAPQWDRPLEMAGVACPKCYRPIDSAHDQGDCDLAGIETADAADISMTIGWWGEWRWQPDVAAEIAANPAGIAG